MPDNALQIVDGFARPDSLYGDRVSTMDVKRELPEHRIMILLKAQGHSNKEIGDITGYTREHVGHVLRQPWARSRLLDILNDRGGSAVDKVLSGEVLNSIDTLVEVRDSDEAGPQARLSAANAILDRALGKPLQRVESKELRVSTSLEEVNQEIARLEAEEAALIGRSAPADTPSPSGPSSGSDVNGNRSPTAPSVVSAAGFSLGK